MLLFCNGYFITDFCCGANPQPHHNLVLCKLDSEKQLCSMEECEHIFSFFYINAEHLGVFIGVVFWNGGVLPCTCCTRRSKRIYFTWDTLEISMISPPSCSMWRNDEVLEVNNVDGMDLSPSHFVTKMEKISLKKNPFYHCCNTWPCCLCQWACSTERRYRSWGHGW